MFRRVKKKNNLKQNRFKVNKSKSSKIKTKKAIQTKTKKQYKQKTKYKLQTQNYSSGKQKGGIINQNPQVYQATGGESMQHDIILTCFAIIFQNVSRETFNLLIPRPPFLTRKFTKFLCFK